MRRFVRSNVWLNACGEGIVGLSAEEGALSTAGGAVLVSLRREIQSLNDQV